MQEMAPTAQHVADGAAQKQQYEKLKLQFNEAKVILMEVRRAFPSAVVAKPSMPPRPVRL